MAQHRFTPQPPILPREPATPQAAQSEDEWGLEEQTEIGMMLPPEAAKVNADDQRRRDSLSSLSLNKGPQTTTMSAPVAVTRSSKLPWVLLALVLAGGGVYIAKTRETATTTAPVAVVPVTPIVPVRAGDLIVSGYIAAKAPIVLAASAGGRLNDLKVDNGDRVQKGQVVAMIADGPLRAELSLANARLRDARRGLQRTRANVKAEGATQSDLERAVGAVEIAEAEVRVIAQKLEETKIRSPVNGTVLEVLARPGEALAVAAGVMRLADLSLLVAEADISEAELKSIVIGQGAEVTTDSQRDRPYKATVREISEQADRSRGTVLVRSYLDATTDGVLKPGMAVQVRILRDPPKPVDVPTSAPVDAGAAAAVEPPVIPVEDVVKEPQKPKVKVRAVPKKTPAGKRPSSGLEI